MDYVICCFWSYTLLLLINYDHFILMDDNKENSTREHVQRLFNKVCICITHLSLIIICWIFIWHCTFSLLFTCMQIHVTYKNMRKHGNNSSFFRTLTEWLPLFLVQSGGLKNMSLSWLHNTLQSIMFFSPEFLFHYRMSWSTSVRKWHKPEYHQTQMHSNRCRVSFVAIALQKDWEATRTLECRSSFFRISYFSEWERSNSRETQFSLLCKNVMHKLGKK
jgi:hypothetical protein